MRIWASKHFFFFFQQENWPNGTVFVIFSNLFVARCFLHYLVIFTIRFSDQNVRFKIKLLRKITVTQFFRTNRSEEKVPNFALDSVSACGFFPFKVEMLIFMHNIWCVNSIFVYSPHVMLKSHVLGVLKRMIHPVAEIMLIGTWHDVAGWKSLISFAFKNIVPFRLFSCIYSIFF